jgi:hypothetical protein
LLYVALLASAAASRRRVQTFDRIPFAELSRAYAEQLGRLFVQEDDLGFAPSAIVLRAFGLRKRDLSSGEGPSSASVAERTADRDRVVVTEL